jgi:hypothetical protein
VFNVLPGITQALQVLELIMLLLLLLLLCPSPL